MGVELGGFRQVFSVIILSRLCDLFIHSCKIIEQKESLILNQIAI